MALRMSTPRLTVQSRQTAATATFTTSSRISSSRIRKRLRRASGPSGRPTGAWLRFLFAGVRGGDFFAGFFVDELLCNGTTTACVFATVHPQSADARRRSRNVGSGATLERSRRPL